MMYLCNILIICLLSNKIFAQTFNVFGKKYAVYN